MTPPTKPADGMCRIQCGCRILFPQSDLDRGRLEHPCPDHAKIDAIAQLRLAYVVGAKLKEQKIKVGNEQISVPFDASGNTTE